MSTESGEGHEVIDVELEKRGLEWTTFNFGVGGMRSFESDYVLQRILALEPERLKVVVIELDDWIPSVGEFSTRRLSYWHDPAHTWRAISYLWRLEDSRRGRLEMALGHLRMAAQRYSAFAEGPRIFSALLGWRSEMVYVTPEELEIARGFQAVASDERSEGHERFVEMYEEDGGDWGLLTARGKWTQEGVRSGEAFAAQLTSLDEAGVRGIYVVGPYPIAPARALKTVEALQATVLPYFDQERYATLFTLESRYDWGHLSHAGARIFSRIFGADLADAALDTSASSRDR